DVAARSEVFATAIWHVLVQARMDGVDGGDNPERIAVRLRAAHLCGTDHGAGTRLVLDHHGLAQALRKLLAYTARQTVGSAAGRKRHDDGNGTLGPGLRLCRCRPKAEPALHPVQRPTRTQD